MKNITVYIVLIALLLAMTACISAGDSPRQTGETQPPASAAEPSKTIAFPRQKKTEGERAVMKARTGGILVLRIIVFA